MAAGVSVATVSKYVNGTKRFSPEVEFRLKQTIEKLGGYVVEACAARRLARGGNGIARQGGATGGRPRRNRRAPAMLRCTSHSRAAEIPHPDAAHHEWPGRDRPERLRSRRLGVERCGGVDECRVRESHCVAVRDRGGGIVRPCGGDAIRRRDRQGRREPRASCVRSTGHEPGPIARRRPQFRIHGRGPVSDRHAGRR